MAKFKTGDRVRYTGAYPIHNPKCIGWTGVVVGLDQVRNTALIDWDNKKAINRHTFQENLEIISESKFKVGDRVCSASANHLAGVITNNRGKLYLVRWDWQPAWIAPVWCDAETLKLVEPAQDMTIVALIDELEAQITQAQTTLNELRRIIGS